MKKMYRNLLTVALVVIFALGLMSLTVKQDPWVVPAKYKTMKNPVKADASSIAAGKTLFLRNCASCHGKTGLGDGPKARTLSVSSGDMSGKTFQDQTDGDHFYKTKFGKGDMPKYDKKIPDEDIWNLVNFMRSLKK